MTRAATTALLLMVLAASPIPAQQAEKPMRPEVVDEPLRAEWCRQLPRPGYQHLERILPGRDWFEVYRIRPGVFAIHEPRQYEEVISYLIVGSKRALLFDTGIGVGDMRAAVARLTSLPVTVLNSHSHFDHTGGNWQFQDILGLDTPYTRHNAEGATHDQVSDAVAPERFCGELPVGFQPERYRIQPFRISRFIRDGERFDLGGRTLEVVLTPGHTPDSLSLLDRKHKLLLVGDTYYPGPIFLYVPETDLAAYGRSVSRLAQLVPKLDLVLTGHNFPVARPEMLTRLADAVSQVQSGKAGFTEKDGQREYSFDGFSLLLAAK